MSEATKPTVGRIVHYVDRSGKHLPAIITNASWGTALNLRVFDDAEPDVDEFYTGVPFDDAGSFAYHTWHWPERD